VVAEFSVLKKRGKPFEKGRARTGGRKIGARNLYSRAVRWIISEAAHQVGGVDRLVAWVKESEANETLFWTQIWPRLLPHASMPALSVEIDLGREINPADLSRVLSERGLPSVLFGSDKPVLELKTENSPTGENPEKGNGADHSRDGNGHDPGSGGGNGATGGD